MRLYLRLAAAARMSAQRSRRRRRNARCRPAHSGRFADGADARNTKLWLFDFDRTLALLEPVVDWAASRARLETALRLAGAPDELFDRFPRGNLLLYDAFRSYLVNRRGENGDVRRSLERLSSIIERFEILGVDRASPLPGATRLLRALRAIGAPVGIVTSNSSVTVGRWLKRRGLEGSAKWIVGRDSLLPLKPAPDMLLRALRLAHVSARRAAFVGDSEADLEAATRAGVAFYGIGATPIARRRLLDRGAAQVFSSPAALAVSLNLPDPGSTAGSIVAEPEEHDAGPGCC